VAVGSAESGVLRVGVGLTKVLRRRGGLAHRAATSPRRSDRTIIFVHSVAEQRAGVVSAAEDQEGSSVTRRSFFGVGGRAGQAAGCRQCWGVCYLPQEAAKCSEGWSVSHPTTGSLSSTWAPRDPTVSTGRLVAVRLPKPLNLATWSPVVECSGSKAGHRSAVGWSRLIMFLVVTAIDD